MSIGPSDVSSLSVLAVGAHPDDVEIFAGGTLAAYASEGTRITVAVATNGEVGGRDAPDAIARRRRAEAQAACELLGAELIWMGFPDEMLFNEPAVRMAFVEAYRVAEADVVFAHSTADYHPDHRIAGQVALDARILSAVPHVKTSTPALSRIPHIFTMDTLGGVDFEPDVLVDISDHQPAKESMLAAHGSQIEWMQRAYGADYIADARRQARRRAEGTGWRFVEAYRSLRTYPVTGGPQMLPGRWRHVRPGEL